MADVFSERWISGFAKPSADKQALTQELGNAKMINNGLNWGDQVLGLNHLTDW